MKEIFLNYLGVTIGCLIQLGLLYTFYDDFVFEIAYLKQGNYEINYKVINVKPDENLLGNRVVLVCEKDTICIRGAKDYQYRINETKRIRILKETGEKSSKSRIIFWVVYIFSLIMLILVLSLAYDTTRKLFRFLSV